MIDEANLNDLQRLALSKISPEVDRGKVEAGEHEVDFTVRVSGLVKVSKNHESIIAAAVPWERVALLALSKLNESSRDKIVRDALGDKEVANDLKDEALAIAAVLKGVTRKEKLGGVRTELVVHEAA